MSDIGIISDLHFKIGRGNNYFLQHVVDSVDNFLVECEKRKVKQVIIGGDIFHVKQSVDTYCLNVCMESIRKITSKYPTVAIVGNHETIRRNNHDINLLNVFASDCTVISDYQYEDFVGVRFHYMPFFDDVTMRLKLKNIKIDPNVKNIMFGHFSFEEYGPNGHEEIYSQMKPHDITSLGINHIYSGHIHGYHSDKKVTYVSSPLESHFNEGGKHGYVFLNIDNPEEHTFVENKLSPKFIEFTLTKDNLKELLEIKDSYVSVILTKKLDPNMIESLSRKIQSKNHYVRIVEDIEPTNTDISVIEGWDNYILMSAEEIIEDYVNKVTKEDDEHTAEELIEEIFRL